MPVVAVGDRLQLGVPESKIPVELVTKLTTPVGVLWFGGEVSVTVAVHVVCPPAPESAAGLQAKLVDVALRPTARIAVPLLLR